MCADSSGCECGAGVLPAPAPEARAAELVTPGADRGPGHLGLGPPPRQRPRLQGQGRADGGGLPGQPPADQHGQVQPAPRRVSRQPAVHRTSWLRRSKK